MKTKKQKYSEITIMKCRMKELSLDLQKVQFKSTHDAIQGEINRLEQLIAAYEEDVNQPSTRIQKRPKV